MAIEIRNLSITSKVVQRHCDGADKEGEEKPGQREQAPADGWDVERRRLMAQLQELRRER
jgi:hypothetical protein